MESGKMKMPAIYKRGRTNTRKKKQTICRGITLGLCGTLSNETRLIEGKIGSIKVP